MDKGVMQQANHMYPNICKQELGQSQEGSSTGSD